MPIRSIYSKERDERRMIIILYCGTLIIMLILLYATYVNMRQFSDAASELRRYNLALVELGALHVDLQEQESIVVGCLLTADSMCGDELRISGMDLTLHANRLDSLLPEPSWRAQLSALHRSASRVRSSLSTLLEVPTRSPGDLGRITTELERERAAMDGFREVHARMLTTVRSAREPMMERQRIDGFSTPIMLILYSALAIAATALLFWRVSRALSSTERAKLDLQIKLAELDMEVEIRTSIQNTLQRVLDTSPNGIMTFRALRDDHDSIIDFEFLTTNEQANAMVGRSDLVGKRLLQEMPENRVMGLFDGYVEVVETGVAFRKEFHYKGSGIDTWFSNHAVRLEDGFMVTFSDITEQRRAQEVNVEADRIALTGQITRTVAHEVRNPLTNIHLAMEQLYDEVEDREEQVRPFFDIIDRNVKRIGSLINGMLESSRKHELSLVPCRMDDIISNAMDQVADRLELKRVKGKVSVAEDLPEVMADRDLINLAITNIAINAVEAMEEEKGVLRMSAYRMGEEVLLEIADNGRGIPPENLSRLFEPFYSGRPGGLGLGLTTARSIFYGHQIRLEVRSTIDEGTTFLLRFPSAIFASAN